ncbi:hypothetical protein PQ455_14945 [Sphingomonas naphthae]|uniref:Uncharacterized protein n=1 Tax=Sphingomonas naphthae TaxID=1813468 RepID=A0ABY7TIH4_9SPHN|nr:hypothetical protein [Sphingomonas naphthae]WCT72919.1 hypothetical protein PQ455_14945 [Sphingomonas naphthae]
MARRNAADVAQAFLDAMWAARPPGDGERSTALNRPLAASHDVAPAYGMASDMEPPEGDWQAPHRQIGARFADYGAIMLSLTRSRAPRTGLLTGDAIDDLADLTRDLRQSRGAASISARMMPPGISG